MGMLSLHVAVLLLYLFSIYPVAQSRIVPQLPDMILLI